MVRTAAPAGDDPTLLLAVQRGASGGRQPVPGLPENPVEPLVEPRQVGAFADHLLIRKIGPGAIEALSLCAGNGACDGGDRYHAGENGFHHSGSAVCTFSTERDRA